MGLFSAFGRNVARVVAPARKKMNYRKGDVESGKFWEWAEQRVHQEDEEIAARKRRSGEGR